MFDSPLIEGEGLGVGFALSVSSCTIVILNAVVWGEFIPVLVEIMYFSQDESSSSLLAFSSISAFCSMTAYFPSLPTLHLIFIHEFFGSFRASRSSCV